MKSFIYKMKSNTIVTVMLYLLGVVLLSTCLTMFVTQRAVVDGNSMCDTLENGDNLLVNKLLYRVSDPERFDIIVFPNPNIKHSYLIKRIIALPGETVRITPKGFIIVNDEPLVETYGREVIKEPGAAVETINLAEDEYFVLGDNRNYSADSRDLSIGNVKRSNIIGKVKLRIWPLDAVGVVE